MAWRRKRYPENMGTRASAWIPPRLDQASMVGRKRWNPLAASWLYTSCSLLLWVHSTYQLSTAATGKASPPLGRIRFSDSNQLAFVRFCVDNIPSYAVTTTLSPLTGLS